MCCVMGYTGHDLSAAKFKEYLLRTAMRGPDDQRVVEGPFGLMGFGRLAIMGLTPQMQKDKWSKRVLSMWKHHKF